MARRLPPLNALKAFEAVARLGSLVSAAEELGVTRSAVSQQIKLLEDHLGIDIFERSAGRLNLTEAGRSLMGSAGRALDMIEQETRNLRQTRLSGTLKIAAPPAFTAKWLVANLALFLSHHPDLEVTLGILPPGASSLPIGYDVYVEYGSGHWPGRRLIELDPVNFTPVCSPLLLNSPSRRLRTPADLRHFRLIHDDDGSRWRRWLASAGFGDAPLMAGLHVENFVYAVDAALAGLGVVLADQITVASSLRRGELVRPLDFAQPGDGRYNLVVLEQRLADPIIRSFVAWIRQEIRSLQ